jgi:hypothetical protein
MPEVARQYLRGLAEVLRESGYSDNPVLHRTTLQLVRIALVNSRSYWRPHSISLRALCLRSGVPMTIIDSGLLRGDRANPFSYHAPFFL